MYVGISAQLKKEIVGHIDKMKEDQFDRVIASAHPFPGEAIGDEWAEAIERKAWGEPIRLKGQLPRDWIHPHTEIDVVFRSDAHPKTLEVRYSGVAIDFPPTYAEQYAPDIVFELDELEPDVRSKILKYWQLIDDTAERYTKTKSEITKLLDRCKSLNEAVQLFPDLRYFLSEGIKYRLDAKRNGGKKEGQDPKLEGIDTALITSAMVVEQLHPTKEDE